MSQYDGKSVLSKGIQKSTNKNQAKHIFPEFPTNWYSYLLKIANFLRVVEGDVSNPHDFITHCWHTALQ